MHSTLCAPACHVRNTLLPFFRPPTGPGSGRRRAGCDAPVSKQTWRQPEQNAVVLVCLSFFSHQKSRALWPFWLSRSAANWQKGPCVPASRGGIAPLHGCIDLAIRVLVLGRTVGWRGLWFVGPGGGGCSSRPQSSTYHSARPGETAELPRAKPKPIDRGDLDLRGFCSPWLNLDSVFQAKHWQSIAH